MDTRSFHKHYVLFTFETKIGFYFPCRTQAIIFPHSLLDQSTLHNSNSIHLVQNFDFLRIEERSPQKRTSHKLHIVT